MPRGVTGSFVSALQSWDPDGAGPMNPRLAVSGTIGGAGGLPMVGVTSWDGARWSTMGQGLTLPNSGSGAGARQFLMLDPDSTGPLPEQLVAVVSATMQSGATPVGPVARFDGTAWHRLGTNLQAASPSIGPAALLDTDGPGPAPTRLVVSGDLRVVTATGTVTSRMAVWDGVRWEPLQAPLTSGTQYSPGLQSMLGWDPDGAGPLGQWLVAAGTFASIGGVTANGVAAWDGARWVALGTGLPARTDILRVESWDHDNDPASPERLVLGGIFTPDGSYPAPGVVWLDGAVWRPFAPGPPGLHIPTRFDPDGPGPRGEWLLAACSLPVGYGVARWTGAEWAPLGLTFDASPMVMSAYDADGPGPELPQLVVGGMFAFEGGRWVARIVRWDERGTYIFGDAMDATELMAVASWDPDGDGPTGELPVVGGSLRLSATEPLRGLAMFDGARMVSVGGGVEGSVSALHAWRPDASRPAVLVAAGQFTSAGGRPAANIAAFDGSAWRALGSGSDRPIQALTTWDPDDAGPAPSLLVACGDFTRIGGVGTRGLAAWDGGGWRSLAPAQWAGTARARAWDPDGAGPAPSELIVQVLGSVLHRYDGVSWRAFPGGPGESHFAPAVWDADGDGPLPAAPVVQRGVQGAAGFTLIDIARWDESAQAWVRLSDPAAGGGLHELKSWDPDGAGPAPALLVATGAFTSIGGVASPYLAAFDGAAWRSIGTGPSAEARQIEAWDPDGPGGRAAELVVVGRFARAGGVVSPRWARYAPTPTPVVAAPPRDAATPASALTTFEATPAWGADFAGPAAFQWLRDGAPIVDGAGGASAGGGVVSGAAGTVERGRALRLRIAATAASDAGVYSVRLSNGCGQTLSRGATLAVLPACPPDLSGDGELSFDDVQLFVALFNAGDPRADFSRDGELTFDDVQIFLGAYNGGC